MQSFFLLLLLLVGVAGVFSSRVTWAGSSETLSSSLGISSISYIQGSTESISELAVTGKIGADAALSSHFRIGGSGYLTLLPIANGDSIRFLGLNGRITFNTAADRRWVFSLSPGVYYTTTFASGNFGFFNLAGPQLFATIRRNLSGGSFITGSAKFSMVADRLSVLKPAQNEVAGGLVYGIHLAGTHFITLSVDIARLSLDVSGVSIVSTSTSLGVGFSF